MEQKKQAGDRYASFAQEFGDVFEQVFQKQEREEAKED